MNTKVNERRARALTFMLSLGMLAGVLIWAKLRLVTDIPRSALADPLENGESPDPQQGVGDITIDQSNETIESTESPDSPGTSVDPEDQTTESSRYHGEP